MSGKILLRVFWQWLVDKLALPINAAMHDF
jgi:hypothetical protein